jgi:uncharacterized protein (TIGR02300 family)
LRLRGPNFFTRQEPARKRGGTGGAGRPGRLRGRIYEEAAVAKPELGAKRVCPETGRKFYDLNKDPIVSPYTGQSYPRSYFESGSPAIEEEEEVEDKEAEAEDEGAETISLEEADDEAKGGSDDLEGEDDDVDLGDDEEDDTFLADEEEDEDDVSGIIGVGDDDDDS